MFNSTSPPTHFPQNPNPNYTYLMNQLDIDVSDYLILKDESEKPFMSTHNESLPFENQISSKNESEKPFMLTHNESLPFENQISLKNESEKPFMSTHNESLPFQNQISSKNIENSVTYSGDTPTSSNIPVVKCESGLKKIKRDVGFRIAFRTKSELEIMDDGFKWRKYGKKRVKNNPNPRNYYRCSNGGCYVKKRVERDGDDNRYVITTYEGVHNHESPCVVYYNETPLMVTCGWTLHPSRSS